MVKPEEAAQEAADLLRSIIERIERKHEERKTLADEIRDVLAEAVSEGFNRNAIKELIRKRAMDQGKREEQEALLKTYLKILDMSPTGSFSARGASGFSKPSDLWEA